jgi:hypothetical protein
MILPSASILLAILALQCTMVQSLFDYSIGPHSSLLLRQYTYGGLLRVQLFLLSATLTALTLVFLWNDYELGCNYFGIHPPTHIEYDDSKSIHLHSTYT